MDTDPHPDTDKDRDWQALDADPDPAKWSRSDRIWIHITSQNTTATFLVLPSALQRTEWSSLSVDIPTRHLRSQYPMLWRRHVQVACKSRGELWLVRETGSTPVLEVNLRTWKETVYWHFLASYFYLVNIRKPFFRMLLHYFSLVSS